MIAEGKEIVKCGQKGVQSGRLQNEHLNNITVFEDILKDSTQYRDEEFTLPMCDNRGFQRRNELITTYRNIKKGLSAFYVKLQLLPCSQHCVPHGAPLDNIDIDYDCVRI